MATLNEHGDVVDHEDDPPHVKAEVNDDEDDDKSYRDEDEKPEGGGSKPKKNHKTPRKSAAGRKLMRWDPAEDQLVLLTVQQVCIKNGINIPWDDVAKEMNDYLTGDAIKQHLVKLTRYREEAGQTVPQKHEKTSSRKNTKEAATATPKTPASGRKKSAKKDTSTEADDSTSGRGNTLLWFSSTSTSSADKKTNTPKKPQAAGKNEVTPVTPSISRGSTKKDKAGDAEKTSSHTRTKSLGKRTRKGKQVVDSSDDEPPVGSESPTKKQKTFAFRAKTPVDYNEHLSDVDVLDAVQEASEDDGYDGSEEAPKKSIKVKETKLSSHSSEESTPRQPPPYFPRLGAAVPSHDNVDTTMGCSSPPYGVAHPTNELTPPWVPEAIQAHYDGFDGAPMAGFDENYHGGGGELYYPNFGNITPTMPPPGWGSAAPIVGAELFGPADQIDEKTSKMASKEAAKVSHKKSHTEYKTDEETESADYAAFGVSRTEGVTTQTDTYNGNEWTSSDDSTTGIIPIADDTGPLYRHDRNLHEWHNRSAGTPRGTILGVDPYTQPQPTMGSLMPNPLYMGGSITYHGHQAFYVPPHTTTDTNITPAMGHLGFGSQQMQEIAAHQNMMNNRFSSSVTAYHEPDHMTIVGYGYMGDDYRTQGSQSTQTGQGTQVNQRTQSFHGHMGHHSRNGSQQWDPNAYEAQHEDDSSVKEGEDSLDEFLQ